MNRIIMVNILLIKHTPLESTIVLLLIIELFVIFFNMNFYDEWKHFIFFGIHLD